MIDTTTSTTAMTETIGAWFALSFDEIIVTTFTAGSGVTTLPIFILNNMFRPNQAPVVSVIAVVLVVVSIIPIYIAQRLSGSEQQRR